MRNIRIGVVEDDPASCQLVLDYLNRYQQENGEQFTVSVFDDGARIVEKHTPVYDILLLDIEMSEMDGMAAARRIRERDDKVVIVFITAAPQYAISGYEVRALSYLLKPLPWFAFSQELKKSIDMVRRNGDDSMLIETGNGQMRLNLADILYLESIRHTIVIHTLDGKYSINGTLKDMEAKLADRHFFRSNSCYLVNLKHVTGVADQDCIMSDDERLRVSRPRKKAFLGTHDAQATSYGVQAIVMLIVIYALCFGLAWLVERGNFSQTTPTLPTASAATATVAITIVTFAMSNLSFVSTNTPFSGSMGQEIFYIRTLVDFCGFAILYAQQEQARRIEASAEIASINAQLESQHQEYLQSKENIESLGRLAHDLKHQIAALRAEVDPEHAAAGFEQLEKSVQRYSAQQHTGNPVLDVILTTKERTCADRGITFTAVADGSLLDGMSSMDIASLFGNALDNAIEATLKLPNPEQRLIKLALFEQNHFIVIRVENYYDSRLSKDADGNLRTTKRDDQHRHGFGVKSIRHIAQQYGGEVTIRTDNHWFVLTALIPRRTGLMAM